MRATVRSKSDSAKVAHLTRLAEALPGAGTPHTAAKLFVERWKQRHGAQQE